MREISVRRNSATWDEGFGAPEMVLMAPTIAALGLMAIAMRPTARTRVPTIRMTEVLPTYSQSEPAGLKVPDAAEDTRVSAWTEWGTLREIVVGNADKANFPPEHAAMHPAVNPEGGSSTLLPDGTISESVDAGATIAREIGWPVGPKNQATIDAANWQLDNLARVLSERGVTVRRPNDCDEQIDWSQPLQTPFFNVPNQYCATCPRDIVATVGNIVLEASMSRRDRYFEVHQYRQLIRQLWRRDPKMLWKAAPKPSMGDDMYDDTWWDLTSPERYAKMHDYTFCIKNDEPIFDAAVRFKTHSVDPRVSALLPTSPASSSPAPSSLAPRLGAGHDAVWQGHFCATVDDLQQRRHRMAASRARAARPACPPCALPVRPGAEPPRLHFRASAPRAGAHQPGAAYSRGGRCDLPCQRVALHRRAAADQPDSAVGVAELQMALDERAECVAHVRRR